MEMIADMQAGSRAVISDIAGHCGFAGRRIEAIIVCALGDKPARIARRGILT